MSRHLGADVAGADDEHHNGGGTPTIRSTSKEFMIMPVGAKTFAEALRCGSEIFHTCGELKKAVTTPMSATKAGSRRTCRRRMPRLNSSCAIGKAGYKAGGDVMLALDCAPPNSSRTAITFYGGENRPARLPIRQNIRRPRVPLSDRLDRDGMSEDDMDGWKQLTDSHWRQMPSWSATTCSSPT